MSFKKGDLVQDISDFDEVIYEFVSGPRKNSHHQPIVKLRPLYGRSDRRVIDAYWVYLVPANAMLVLALSASD